MPKFRKMGIEVEDLVYSKLKLVFMSDKITVEAGLDVIRKENEAFPINQSNVVSDCLHQEYGSMIRCVGAINLQIEVRSLYAAFRLIAMENNKSLKGLIKDFVDKDIVFPYKGFTSGIIVREEEEVKFGR